MRESFYPFIRVAICIFFLLEAGLLENPLMN